MCRESSVEVRWLLRHGQEGFLEQVDIRAGHHERLEAGGETCLVLLRVAKEGSESSLEI